MKELQDFCTPVPLEGFEWVSARTVNDDFTISDDQEDFLIDPAYPSDSPRADDPRWDDKGFREEFIRGRPAKMAAQYRSVRPFVEVVPVFDRFAAIEIDKESILEFANQYGSLGKHYWGAPEKSRLRRMKAPTGALLESFRPGHYVNPSWYPFEERAFEGGFIAGDPLANWMEEQVAIATCALLFRLMLRKNESAIESMFDRKLGEYSSKVYKDAQFYSKLNDKGEYAPWHATPKQMAGDLICYLTRSSLKGCVSSLSFRNDQFSLAAAPDTLLEAIWLELAHAAQDIENYRECETCKFLFCVGDDGSRKTRRYCSDACRMKALRERQSHARQLRADGMHLREIAKELGVDKMETVKAWVADVPMP